MIEKAYRVKTEVEVVKDDLGDAFIEAGKKVVGAGLVVGSWGCAYKAIQEKNIELAALSILLGILGSWLILS